MAVNSVMMNLKDTVKTMESKDTRLHLILHSRMELRKGSIGQ
jgi:hypothetical protein